MAKEDRGFASMDRAKQREIASKGGKAAHQKGTAHEWTSEEAREAGRKGGMASHRRRSELTAKPGGDDDAQNLGSPDVSERDDSIERADSRKRSSSSRHRFILKRPARDCARPLLLCTITFSRLGDSRVLARMPRSSSTGRSFNGRTRRSGRRYRGSNPCLPASLPHHRKLQIQN